VAGGVDQVDVEVADRERRDVVLDGDATTTLECERVRRRVTAVDRAEAGDGPGVEEEAFGETCLTGVDVREDAEVERRQGCSPSEGRRSGVGALRIAA
jgi:hypothetical protein